MARMREEGAMANKKKKKKRERETPKSSTQRGRLVLTTKKMMS
jgi:hypothetical protein